MHCKNNLTDDQLEAIFAAPNEEMEWPATNGMFYWKKQT